MIALALTSSASTAGRATFPGTNGPLVFSGLDATTGTLQIYRVAADGSQLTQLTQAMGQVWNECPSLSADGTSIFFDSQNRGTQPPSSPHIYRMRADGSGRQLADRPRAPAHACPSVGPGGTQIVVMQFGRQGNSTIVRMNLDGTRRRTLGPAGLRQNNYDPLYAPDGRRVVYNRVTFRARGGIARADLIVSRGLGRQSTNITARSRGLFFDPSWAPDGTSLLAVRGSAANTIVRMNADGGSVRVLKTVAGVTLASPVLSPDGTKIAYLQCEGDCGDPTLQGNGSLWVMDADGSDSVAIVTQQGSAVQPTGKVDWGVARAPAGQGAAALARPKHRAHLP